MNHCKCGARLDDDYVSGDVGAAFWPDTPDGYGDFEFHEFRASTSRSQSSLPTPWAATSIWIFRGRGKAMPHLYCEMHGREQEARCEADQNNYRLLGETLLLVSGSMKTASLRCNRCNIRLRRFQPGWLVTAFSRHSADELSRYDYRQEREYFLPDPGIEVRFYGAAPADRHRFARRHAPRMPNAWR